FTLHTNLRKNWACGLKICKQCFLQSRNCMAICVQTGNPSKAENCSVNAECPPKAFGRRSFGPRQAENCKPDIMPHRRDHHEKAGASHRSGGSSNPRSCGAPQGWSL